MVLPGITKKEEGTKSNAELKAERRAKQEAQRAAKLESKPTTKSIPNEFNFSIFLLLLC